MVSSSALPHRRRSLVATLYLALCALALALPAAVAVAEEVSIDAAGQVEPVSQEDESTAHVNKVTIAAEDAAIPVEGVYQLEDAVEPRDSVQPDHVNQVDEVNTATPEQPEAIGDGDNDENIEHFVKILYSANQEGTYAPAVNFLEERFPELQGRFTGDFYPQPPIAEFLLRVLQFVQFFAIVWMLGGGKKMLRMLPMYKQGRPLPKFYWIIHDNPVPILIFLFIVARPMLNQMQLKRSAFEIYLDDVLVFSLRSAGRIRPDALIEVFVQAGMTLVEPKK